MQRKFSHWLKAYLEYASFSEAPKLMHFYAGVSAIAGALRRRVWIDQHYFRWTPNFFIIFVAPPGVVSKSTTADIAMDLLRPVSGVHFGPDIITWPALVTALGSAGEQFQHNGEWIPMSPLTLVASELGNLLSPTDKEMVDLFITLWDGRRKLEKVTKGNGVDIIESPWINLLGCTTPSWISDNLNSSAITGGFASRCIFVYAEEKEKFVAYPKFSIPSDILEIKKLLINDLEYIATTLCGECQLSPEAVKWGTDWYETLWKTRPPNLEDDRFSGYIARKQTHLHKLAMVFSAAQRDTLVLEKEDLEIADQMLLAVETDMVKVFSRIGRKEDSLQVDRLISFIERKGVVTYAEAYRLIHSYFPNLHDFEGLVAGAIKAGYIKLEQRGTEIVLIGVNYDKINATKIIPFPSP